MDIALAMIYMHNNQILHRDLKTENCLINSDMKVKICDFGTSQLKKD